MKHSPNDLAQYWGVRSLMRPGDLIVFWGASPLSWLIRLFATGPSHCAVVRQGMHAGQDVKIIESTIENGKNGVQTNGLEAALAGADEGTAAAWLPLSRDSRSEMDWEAFYALCGEAEGHVRYDELGLVEFLLREIPILGPRVGQDEHPDLMVCSAWATALYERSKLLRGINWSKVSPEDLVEMRIYGAAVPILGKPRLSRRFNTV